MVDGWGGKLVLRRRSLAQWLLLLLLLRHPLFLSTSINGEEREL